ncbi:hypothetical protein ABA31_07000 [Agrococcus baldri]|uniref:Uncharacterized protein n=1 Tax=Agrococcus baldri TaxID=153730 RepID=A0AA87URA6_9MICO|nr:hypothetical protein ABA31_07000 [Agrococcus baldri]
MCRAAKCSICGKTTWAGCGKHVNDVRRTVAAADWCPGRHTQRDIDEAKAARRGFLARLFGR